jgi:hypothetical protein
MLTVLPGDYRRLPVSAGIWIMAAVERGSLREDAR